MKDTLLKVVAYISLGLGLTGISLTTVAQTTTSHSPYSQFGLGQMREDLTPQQRAMGGVSTGLQYLGGLPTLNVSNPASYAAMNRTIFDGGMYGNITQLGKGSARDNTADFAFGHMTFGIPLRKSDETSLGGISFGLIPFSDVGYNASTTRPLDTIQYKSSLTGEGGLNKAYFGYGLPLPIKGLSVGANAGFLFGNLTDKASIEFPYNLSAYNTIQTDNRYITGLTVDYGLQYFRALGGGLNLTLGYSGSLNNTVTNKTTTMVTITEGGLTGGDAVALDTLMAPTEWQRNINLPLRHNVGFVLSKGYNWTVGADFKYADWSYLQTRVGEPQLGKNMGVAVGGQIKPDPLSSKYLNIVDYRLGFRYNQTEVTLNNRRINDMAVTAGIGLPLAQGNFGRTFSMINISAEFGQRGTLQSNLVREQYINLHFGFTINDRWFIRRSID